MKDNQKYR